MGTFATPDEVKARVGAAVIQSLESADLDDLWIVPAERRIEQVCNLDLDTNGNPWRWRATFTARADLEARYLDDYRRAVILLINQKAANPHGYSQQAIAGASVTYGRDFPTEVSVIMGRWGKGSSVQGTVFR